MSICGISDVQILFVEMQPPILAFSATQNARALKGATAVVKRIADALAIPMMASVVPLGDEAPRLIDELASVDIQARSSISVFADEASRNRLASNKRSTIVVAGVSSEIAILHTTLDARRAGYEVAVLIDCCGGLSSRTEEAALDQMRAAGVIITNISSFFTGVFSDMASPEGGTVMEGLAELWSWGACALDTPIEQHVAILFGEMTDAWQAGDADRFAATFAEEARFIAFDGTVLIGPKEIAEFHKSSFAAYLKGSSLILRATSIEAVTDAVILVASRGGITKDGTSQDDLIGDSAQTFVLGKSQAGLNVRNFQNTRIRPLGEPGATVAWQTFDRAWRDRGAAP